jgi:hypothetical protein
MGKEAGIRKIQTSEFAMPDDNGRNSRTLGGCRQGCIVSRMVADLVLQ